MNEELREESQEELQKAGFGKRLGAFLIDHVILAVILVGGFFSLVMQQEPEKMLYYFPVLMLVGAVFYCLKDIFGGASIGKRTVGLAVRSGENSELIPSPGKLFLRNILTFVWPLELIVLLSSKSKRKLGDTFAGTDVYSISKKVKPALIIIVAIIVVAAFAGSITLLLKNDDSYKTAITYIENNEDIRSVVGDINGYGFFVQGGLSYSGAYGKAEYTIKVLGDSQSLYVRIVLEKERGRYWEVVRCLPVNSK
jgi:uncharacterized RDD family membrane protein YckC